MNGMAIRDGGRVRLGLLCGLAFLALAGCQENGAGYGAISADTNIPKPPLDLSAAQGVPVTQGEPLDVSKVASTRKFGSRSNPFALTGIESEFDKSQTTDRFLSSAGGFVLEIEPTLNDPGEQAPVVEPVPNWRLSGVLIGSGVMALLDTGPQTYEIRPGMTVPGTEWRVVSIDSDRALLARDGNKLPHEFYVGLSGPIAGDGITVAGAGNAGGGTGDPRGGRVGAGPPR